MVARRAHNPKVRRFKSPPRNQKENINQTVGVFLFVMLGKGRGFELGASNLKVACSPTGEKTVQWTVLREAREKQIPSPQPKRKHSSFDGCFSFCIEKIIGRGFEVALRTVDTYRFSGRLERRNPFLSRRRQSPHKLRLFSPYQGAEPPQPSETLLNHLWLNSVFYCDVFKFML